MKKPCEYCPENKNNEDCQELDAEICKEQKRQKEISREAVRNQEGYNLFGSKIGQTMRYY